MKKYLAFLLALLLPLQAMAATSGPNYFANFNSFYQLNNDFYFGPVNGQTGTTYTIASSDLGTLTTFSNASAIAVTLPQAANALPLSSYIQASFAFAKGWFAFYENINSGIVTITPTTSTINNASTLVLRNGDTAMIYSDGINYWALLGGVSTNATQTLYNKTLASGSTLTDVIDQGVVVSNIELDKTTDVTLATVNGLSVSLTAGKTYACWGHLTGTSTANGGYKVQPTASGGLTATSSSFTISGWNGVTINNRATQAIGNVAGATLVYTDVYIEGAIVVNAGGTLSVQFAQNVSHADTSKVYINSYFTCKRTN